jgi:hypothetical protein
VKATAGELAVSSKVFEGPLAAALSALESGHATKSQAKQAIETLKGLLAQEPALLTRDDRSAVMKLLQKAQSKSR